MTAREVVLLTGAGISADSGVATFRDADGLWEGHPVEQVATPQGWDQDPELVWRFYQERRSGLAQVEPNAAHRALVELEQRLIAADVGFTLITQNVDDLHERAGTRRLLHMHGELAVLRCESCGVRARDLEHLDPETFVPCGSCGHVRLRPDVIWFGELPYFLPEIEGAMGRCTEFLAIGTSGVVYPAAGLLELARECGARTWVNSLELPDNADRRDFFRPGRAAEVVPTLVTELIEALGL